MQINGRNSASPESVPQRMPSRNPEEDDMNAVSTDTSGVFNIFVI
jgi:hypothetical protein